MNKKYRFCVICGCTSDRFTHLHTVPKDDNRRCEWMMACNKYLHENSFVCSRHFPKHAIAGRRLEKYAVPSCSKQNDHHIPRKDDTFMTLEVEEPSTLICAPINEFSFTDSTHYIQKDEVERFEKCCACMEPLPNELYRAPVTMLCYDDKTVKDGLQSLLLSQLAQAQDGLDDDNRRCEWMMACNKYLHENSFVCSRHFPKHAIAGRRLEKYAVPSCSKQNDHHIPRKDDTFMTLEVEEPSTLICAPINEFSFTDSTHYIQKDEVERFEKCCACMEPLPNELYRAPVTMLCYDDKTVKDGLQSLLLSQLAQAQDGLDVSIKDEDFVCDSCFIVLRNTLKFIKKCLHTREQMKEHLQDNELQEDVFEVESDENVINVNHCSFLPLRYAKVPDHNEVISIKDVSPRCLHSLQIHGVKLLQNCKTYDDFYENKRVLLVGNRAYVNCPLCVEPFATEDAMLKHFTEVHDLSKAFFLEQVCHGYEKNYTNNCQGCGRTFSHASHKSMHLKKCRMFLCSYCNNVFNESKLASHTKQEHGDPYPFKCFKCKQEKSDYKSLNSHICNESNSCPLKSCSECNRKISATLYDEHMESHSVPCPKCGKVFQTRYSLRKHMNRHKSRLCPICGKVFKVLSKHMLTHAETSTKTIPCTQCPKLFHRPTEMKMHVKQAHETKKVICEICGEQLRDTNMKRHVMLKHATRELQCEICLENFTNVRSLNRHARKHTGSIQLKNTVPTKTKKYDFRKNDPVVCQHCLKSFKNLVYLRIHMKTHTKYSRVRCRYCSNTYANVKCRWQHEVRHHRTPNNGRTKKSLPGPKKTSELNVCAVCGELFGNIELMNTHLEEEHNVTSEAGPVVRELAKEVMLGFQALDFDESLFFMDEPSASNCVEIVQMDGDSDS